MNDFEQYIQQYEIDLVILSVVGKVRYLTVYNAKKGNPITPENAQKIKEAVLRLTGIPYVGSFVLIQEPSPHIPPIRVRKMSGNYHHSRKVAL